MIAKKVIEEILAHENINANQLAKSIGVNPTQIYDFQSGKTKKISPSMAEKIIKVFPTFSRSFLLSGEGELIKKEGEEERPIKNFKKGRPYYNTEYKMGYELPFDGNYSNPDYLIDFTPYNSCDFWCNASGDSMSPTIANGDIVAFKEIKDFTYLLNNEVYGFELNNGLRTIKRCKDKGDSYILIPDNKEYDEQIIPKSEIRRVFKVMGTVKRF